MPKFILRTINSTFFSQVELEDQPHADDALAYGVRAALMIASDELHAGTSAAAVEVIIDDAAGQRVRRSSVSVCVAPLAVGPVEEKEFPQEANDR